MKETLIFEKEEGKWVYFRTETGNKYRLNKETGEVTPEKRQEEKQ